MRGDHTRVWGRCLSRPTSSAGRCWPAECLTICRKELTWRELEKAVEENRDGLIGRIARWAWAELTGDEQRYRQLRVISRFALTVDQAKALLGDLAPSDVIENPYSSTRLGWPMALRSPRSTAACGHRTQQHACREPPRGRGSHSVSSNTGSLIVPRRGRDLEPPAGNLVAQNDPRCLVGIKS